MGNTGLPKAVGVQKTPNKRVKPPCRAMRKEVGSLSLLLNLCHEETLSLSFAGPEPPLPLTLPLARSHLCPFPQCRPVRHLFASFSLHCHSTRLLASCFWPKALQLTPGHVGLLLPALLGFPVLTEHFSAAASAAATFHLETKRALGPAAPPGPASWSPGLCTARHS